MNNKQVEILWSSIVGMNIAWTFKDAINGTNAVPLWIILLALISNVVVLVFGIISNKTPPPQ